MVGLYAMLFIDDVLEKGGAMEFNWDPSFLGPGLKKCAKETFSLQKAVLTEREGKAG